MSKTIVWIPRNHGTITSSAHNSKLSRRCSAARHRAASWRASWRIDTSFQRVNTAEEVSIAFATQSWDLFLADPGLSHLAKNPTLDFVRKNGTKVPLIFVSSKKKGTNGRNRSCPEQIVRISKSNLQEFFPVVKRTLRSGGERQQRKRVEGLLKYHLGDYDHLTNLPNRNLIHRQLQQATMVSRKDDKEWFALLIMVLNGFKEINHTLGPHNRDLQLKQVAERFAVGLKRFAAKGRLGGD